MTNAAGYTVGDKNPFRYRGYYYDTETGLYYLNSRYYSPEFGRFISADVFIITTSSCISANVFIYCANNPIVYADSNGYSPIWSLQSDWAGRAILYHWLFGNGTDYIVDDKRWGDYMRANVLLNQQIAAIVSEYETTFTSGTTIGIDVTKKAEIENGESIIGYQYLHGTNADAGGLHVSGNISKNKYNDISYTLSCTWNDMIDLNYKYTSDRKKVEFAKKIPFANPQDYYISITWSVSGTKLSRHGCGGSRTISVLN